MKRREVVRLAWRGLSRRPVRTGLTALGITVAVASMVVFLSLGEGLREVFRDELGSVGPDVQVARGSLAQGLFPAPTLPPGTVQDIARLAPELGITRVTPVVVSLRQSLDPAQSAVFYGLPARQGVQALFPGVRAGRGRLLLPDDEDRAVAVLGARAARNLGLGVGDTLALNRRASARVVGVLAPQNSLTDTFTFLPLGAVGRAFGTGDRLSLVAVRLERPGDARRVASSLSRQLGLTATTRSDFLSFVGRMLRSSDALSLGLSVVSLVVGGLAVVNTVLMGVYERTREFGTLRAIGARPAFVRTLVLTESLLLALAGGVGGLLLGLAGIWAVNLYTQDLAGIDAAALTPRLTGLALGISLLLGLISGLLPARSAGRLSITEALGRV